MADRLSTPPRGAHAIAPSSPPASGEIEINLIGAVAGANLGSLKVTPMTRLLDVRGKLLEAVGGQAYFHEAHLLQGGVRYDDPLSTPFTMAATGDVYALFKAPTSATLHVCCYKVTDRAADVWPRRFEGYEDTPLYACVLNHQGRSAALLFLHDSFNDYLEGAAAENASNPKDLTQLQEKCAIRLVNNSGVDERGFGEPHWTSCFYIGGDESALHKFLLLLDGFIIYRSKQIGKTLDVHLRPHKGIDFAKVWDELSYETYSLHDPEIELPVSYFQCAPVQGRQHVIIHISAVDEETFSIVLRGGIRNYCRRMDEHGIEYGYKKVTEWSHGRTGGRCELLGFISSMSLRDKTHFLNLLGDAVFRHLAIKVLIDKEPVKDSPLAKYLDELRQEVPNLHF